MYKIAQNPRLKSMADAISANFQDLIDRVEQKGERIIIERQGKAVVAIIGLEDLKRLEALEDAIDSQVLHQAISENNGFTTLDAVIASRGDE
ncbi:type II toxin-antitoxin system Phd/YefM family antitoxin [Nostoc sp. PCC 7107]|uniref:type II toxin-antitoxin system Phd/YefM family antitoxin n=1 Tax=Nostoc sp. PCC 7107 TaxID=317936 RepID=UPI00029F254B|nr:type II toxin-antitoxin system Phd/YefM family antitoxin [Nostoc sp. PCC 7107]AFY43658.1 prevent-host-death family protein [Nostoc sp. PCC 7107]